MPDDTRIPIVDAVWQSAKIGLMSLALIFGGPFSEAYSSTNFVILKAIDDGNGGVAWSVQERGFPNLKTCERKMHKIENGQDIVLRCVEAKDAL